MAPPRRHQERAGRAISTHLRYPVGVSLPISSTGWPMLRRLYLAVSVPALLLSRSPLHAQAAPISDAEALRRANVLLAHTPLIDGHNDLPWVIREDSLHPR